MTQRRQSRSKKKKSLKPKHELIKKVTIDSMAHDGRGVGRDAQGKVAFVDGALPSETVRYTVLESRKKFNKGTAVEVLGASEHRVDPKCEIFGKCGGCALQHLSAEQQVVHKQQQLIDNLQRIGNVVAAEVLDPIVGKQWSYRRRARFGATFAQTKNEVRLGFRARNSHYVQPAKTCHIVDEKIDAVMPELRFALSQLYCSKGIKGVDICVADEGLSILVLVSEYVNDDDKSQLIYFAQENELQIRVKQNKEPEQVLHSMPALEEKPDNLLSFSFKNISDLPDLKVDFSANDFTQVNPQVNELLLAELLRHLDLRQDDRVLDLFCGIGNFTLPMATKAKHVVGVEGSDEAVERAEHNSRINSLDNTQYHVCDLFDESIFPASSSGELESWQDDDWEDEWDDEKPEAVESGEVESGAVEFDNDTQWLDQKFDKIVLDPPRAGAANIVKNIDRFEARTIVYISCDPATLARDANTLVHDHGYTLKNAGVADMFPHTAHIESIAVFVK